MPHPDQVFFSTSFFRAAWILCRSRWRPANDWLVSAAVALVSDDLLISIQGTCSLVFGGKLIGESYTFLKVHVHRNDAEQSGTIPFFSIPRRLWRTMRYRVEDLDHSVLVLVSWRQLHARFLFLNILQYCWENNRTRSFIRIKYMNRMFHFSDRVSIVLFKVSWMSPKCPLFQVQFFSSLSVLHFCLKSGDKNRSLCTATSTVLAQKYCARVYLYVWYIKSGGMFFSLWVSMFVLFISGVF